MPSKKRKCSNCRRPGHDKRTCFKHSFGLCYSKLSASLRHAPFSRCINATKKSEKKVKTEDLGQIFEYAICLSQKIPFDGNFKYSIEEATKLSERLEPLSTFSPHPLTHTAARGARYDFTEEGSVPPKHLSAKTTKSNNSKVAPQVIGQPKPKKFCDEISNNNLSNFKIPFVNIPTLKKDIQTKIIHILPYLIEYTFDSHIIYYNKESDSIKYIINNTLNTISWGAYKYYWTRPYASILEDNSTSEKKVWNSSSTFGIIKEEKRISLLEFQFHSNGRSNMAIRWCFENFLNLFGEHLDITEL